MGRRTGGLLEKNGKSLAPTGNQTTLPRSSSFPNDYTDYYISS